ncbi:hypothetical protein HNY73_010482 [Argiope bruennichi]|uniref:Uncharacterized protein n=1 Tax=Argiope bruennichi TaxID=94029 RepID=A0A8T0F3N3_ARGBR|nr:hypothetical protein HNY73_010482 [Argiope bruennichi]
MFHVLILPASFSFKSENVILPEYRLVLLFHFNNELTNNRISSTCTQPPADLAWSSTRNWQAATVVAQIPFKFP